MELGWPWAVASLEEAQGGLQLGGWYRQAVCTPMREPQTVPGRLVLHMAHLPGGLPVWPCMLGGIANFPLIMEIMYTECKKFTTCAPV